MDLSKLTAAERMATYAAAVVVITGVISLVNNWGTLMLIAFLAGGAVLVALLVPQLSPSTNLPAPRGPVVLGAGVVAAVAFVVTAIDWLDWIGEHVASFDTLQFLVGLIASLVMAWAGWRVNQEAGRRGPATPPTSTVG